MIVEPKTYLYVNTAIFLGHPIWFFSILAP